MMNVCRLRLEDTHLPEHRSRFEPVMKPPATETHAPDGAARPIKLLAQPEKIDALAEVPDGAPHRFSWRRISYRVARASGPERIADEWRRQAAARPTRDYYRIETEDGRRYWIYREGLYGRETLSPQWFLHGIFP